MLPGQISSGCCTHIYSSIPTSERDSCQGTSFAGKMSCASSESDEPQMLDADEGPILVPSSSKYFHYISRELAKERHQVYNRICSILDDADFVTSVAECYPGLPVLANLRCGLWYLQHPDDCCYFKSTDGHHGNWSFSLTRLNVNVVEWVAKQGGCIIVDATRKGKKFPVRKAKVANESCNYAGKCIRIFVAKSQRCLPGCYEQNYTHLGGCYEQGCRQSA